MRCAKRLEDDSPERLRSEEHTSELQSHSDLVCRLLLEKKKNNRRIISLTSIQAQSQACAPNATDILDLLSCTLRAYWSRICYVPCFQYRYLAHTASVEH